MPADPLPLDLRAICETLRSGRATDAWMNGWLPRTYADPERFGEALYAYLGARRGTPFKSRPREGCDLYHDAVSAHLGRRRHALLAREGEAWTSVSYESLHARCNALASAWIEQGAAPKQTVAVVAPPGVDQAVALLTALRLGMVPTLIPALGPAYVRAALARGEVDAVAVAGRHRGLIGPGVERVLPVAAGARGTGPTGSFTYPPGKPAARLLTPFGRVVAEAGGGAAPAPVEARVLLDGAARDAAFAYCIDSPDIVAAPGFDAAQHEPAMLLAALVAGATRAYLSEEELAAEPELLGQLGVTVLGLHRRVRDLWMGQRRKLPAGVRLWFRSLSDEVEGNQWDEFWRTVPDRKQLNVSLLNGAAGGGVGLLGVPTAAAPSLRVWPAPGVVWRLGELGASEVPALSETGVFVLLRGEDIDPGFAQAVIGRWGEGFAYGGTLDLGPDAHPYPCADAEAVVERLEGVQHAAAFTTGGRWLNESRVVLLVFAEGPFGARPPVEVAPVAALLERELGPRFVPDRIEVMPLRPRFIDGEVDRAWCRSQYLTGALHRKARAEVFMRLGRLGYIFAPDRAPK